MEWGNRRGEGRGKGKVKVKGIGMRRGRILQRKYSYLGHGEGPRVGGMLEVYHFSRGHTSTIWIVLCCSSVSD